MSDILNSAVLVASVSGLFLVLSKLVEVWLSGRLKSKNTLADAVDKAGKIYPILWELVNEFHPKRVAIFQFHNGGHYFSGESIQRMTMTYEVNQTSVRSAKADFQSVIISGSYYIGLRDLLDNHMVYYPDVSEMRDSDLRSLLTYYRSKGFFATAIFDNKEQLVAVLTMCFDKTSPLPPEAVAGVLVKKQNIQNLITAP
jgi:hypothetical protein